MLVLLLIVIIVDCQNMDIPSDMSILNVVLLTTKNISPVIGILVQVVNDTDLHVPQSLTWM